MKGDHVLLACIDTIQSRRQAVQGVVISHHYQHVTRPYSQGFRSKIVASFQVELVEFSVGACALPSDGFRDFKNGKEDDRECDSGDGRNLFSEKINATECD